MHICDTSCGANELLFLDTVSFEIVISSYTLLQRRSSAAVQNCYQLRFLNRYRWPVVDNPTLSATVLEPLLIITYSSVVHKHKFRNIRSHTVQLFTNTKSHTVQLFTNTRSQDIAIYNLQHTHALYAYQILLSNVHKIT
jgi:hypothetical protein